MHHEKNMADRRNFLGGAMSSGTAVELEGFMLSYIVYWPKSEMVSLYSPYSKIESDGYASNDEEPCYIKVNLQNSSAWTEW